MIVGATPTSTYMLSHPLPLAFFYISGESKSVVHWGQRKLILHEIEFLNRYSPPGHPPSLVAYAGAAPGTHIPLLAALFPALTFLLVDPSNFDIPEDIPRVHVYRRFFTDDFAASLRRLASTLPADAKAWDEAIKSWPREQFGEYGGIAAVRGQESEEREEEASGGQQEADHEHCQESKVEGMIKLRGGGDVYFVSDVRTADWTLMDPRQVEDAVADDLSSQMRWHALIRPTRSLLKFRLPYESAGQVGAAEEREEGGVTHYLDGKIMLPIFGPPTTTECRLDVGGDAPTRKYSNVEYGEAMFYHNTVSRVCAYPHKAQGGGLDHCYDCSCEVQILRSYLESHVHAATALDDATQNEGAPHVEAWSRRISEVMALALSGQLDDATIMLSQLVSLGVSKRGRTLESEVPHTQMDHFKSCGKSRSWAFMPPYMEATILHGAGRVVGRSRLI